ncbi:MAG TPA: outer membrane beta-barrel protein [Polyangiaceae bacterium]|nr:outer membrane beta-barrel protein [Polyangiaceae bacterium]
MRISPELRGFGILSTLLGVSMLREGEAQAFERQWHVGIDAGYAMILDEGVSGFGGGAHGAYGLSDSFNAMLELAVTRQAGAAVKVATGDVVKDFSLETMASAAAGVAYTIDVARAVPYVGVLAAGYRVGTLSAFSPGGQLALGLDYQLERNWAVGAQIRLHTIFTADAGTLAYATTFLRVEYLWGF